jgi:hypothetical protein
VPTPPTAPSRALYFHQCGPEGHVVTSASRFIGGVDLRRKSTMDGGNAGHRDWLAQGFSIGNPSSGFSKGCWIVESRQEAASILYCRGEDEPCIVRSPDAPGVRLGVVARLESFVL